MKPHSVVFWTVSKKAVTMIVLLTTLLLLQSIQCHGFHIQPKIVNGIESDPSHFPFFGNIENTEYRCGASLISNKWILTAAHCIISLKPLQMLVGIGPNGHFEKNISLDISHYYMYPEFDYAYATNDIALIELPKPIEFSRSIQPAKLPTNCDDIDEHENVIASGRGIMETYAFNVSEALLHGFSKTLTQLDCAQALNDTTDPRSVICAISPDNQYVFKGDSGGPLTIQKDGTLVGVASLFYGTSKSVPDLQVFTKIQHYFGWIASKTGIKLPKCDNQAPAYAEPMPPPFWHQIPSLF